MPVLPITARVAAAPRSAHDDVPPEIEDDIRPVLDEVRSVLRLETRFRVRITGRLLRHRGLGSTTQLRGLVAVAAAGSMRQVLSPLQLSALDILDVGSCVGLTLMAHPGVVLDLGFEVSRQPSGHYFTPHARVPGYFRRPRGVFLRLEAPPKWWMLIAIPPAPAISGEEERNFWSDRLPTDERAAEETSYRVLMDLLPAFVAHDLTQVHAALDAVSVLHTKSDEIARQSDDVRRVMEVLAARYGFSGLSSLGPATYTITEQSLSDQELLELAGVLPPDTEILQCPLPAAIPRSP